MIVEIPARFRAACDLCGSYMDPYVHSAEYVEAIATGVHGCGPLLCRECHPKRRRS